MKLPDLFLSELCGQDPAAQVKYFIPGSAFQSARSEVARWMGRELHQPSKRSCSLLECFKGSRKEVVEHERTLDPNNIRDYIDGYLLEIKKRNDPAFC
ncbi:hypothetical protein AVEN_62551-1, partial [Araneus ventricosus]